MSTMAPPPQSPAGETVNPKASRPWFKKKRWWLVGVIVLFFIIPALGNDENDSSTAASSTSVVEETASAEDTAAADEAATARASEEAAAAEASAAAADKAAADKAAADKAAADKAAADKAAAEAAALEVVPVQAAQLLADFDGNEAAADATYGGKILEVTGLVDEVDTAMFSKDKYVLRMGDGTQYSFLTVNCNDLPAASAATVQAGTTVTVRGVFDDGGDLGVELKECAVL